MPQTVCVRETAYSIAVGVGTVWLMGLQPMFSSVCEKKLCVVVLSLLLFMLASDLNESEERERK